MIVIEEAQEWIPSSIISPVCYGNIIPELEFPCGGSRRTFHSSWANQFLDFYSSPNIYPQGCRYKFLLKEIQSFI